MATRALSTEVRTGLEGALAITNQELALTLTDRQRRQFQAIAETVQAEQGTNHQDLNLSLAVVDAVVELYGENCTDRDIKTLIEVGIRVKDLPQLLEASVGMRYKNDKGNPEYEQPRKAAPEVPQAPLSDVERIMREALLLSGKDDGQTSGARTRSLTQVSESRPFDPILSACCYHAFWEEVSNNDSTEAFDSILRQRFGPNYGDRYTRQQLLDKVGAIADRLRPGTSSSLALSDE